MSKVDDNGKDFWDRLKPLMGAPFIAVVLVYINSTVVNLSVIQMVVLAVIISVSLHEIIPSVVKTIRGKNSA
ncbi:hypothetical protein [Natrinema halophilum]|uniref:Uncharacterized protein n=1 Tax=Natrinema halophilum TaxID=1699371 RepID=A0A7D5H414_9EURY|nr:hypothetical protein [Natrinema halophilum]QLG50271.1 hypothetical protein HYG82_16175 [Natrinema halophilum]